MERFIVSCDDCDITVEGKVNFNPDMVFHKIYCPECGEKIGG